MGRTDGRTDGHFKALDSTEVENSTNERLKEATEEKFDPAVSIGPSITDERKSV